MASDHWAHIGYCDPYVLVVEFWWNVSKNFALLEVSALPPFAGSEVGLLAILSQLNVTKSVALPSTGVYLIFLFVLSQDKEPMKSERAFVPPPTNSTDVFVYFSLLYPSIVYVGIKSFFDI